ncbi:hypothetical protein AXW83_25325 [Bosea sp. PAMC 26642]|nr:hypothetical protein AXW83_25325 [Bosea sp. PAMC 26642]
MDVSEALAKIAAAISHRGDLHEKWQQDLSSARLLGLQSSVPIAIKEALLHAASLGLLNDDAAERLAAELDCGPLANKPDIAKFDPREDAYWSLPMAMVWMMSRDWERVALQMSAYRAAHEDWYCESNVGLPKDGALNGYLIAKSWQIKSWKPAAIDRLLLGDSFDAAQSVRSVSTMTATEAKRLLWRALQEQLLIASGRRDGARKPIPAFLWQDLLPFQDGLNTLEYLREGSHGPRWDDVTVSRADVLREWPSNTVEVSMRDGEPEVEKWRRFASLPLTPWLPLEVVLSFVQDGWAFHSSNTALNEFEVPTGEDGRWRRQGALLAHQAPGTSDYDDPAIDRFNMALTRAGLEERVRFRGVPYGSVATDIRDIPSSYFVEMRVFGPIPVHNPTISDIAEGARRQHHWESVTLERLGFLRWLANEYSTIARLHRDYAPVALPWAADSVREFIAGAAKRMTGDPGPLTVSDAAAWLAWDGMDPPPDCLEKSMVEALTTATANLLHRIAIGSLSAFGSKKGQAPERLESRWFRDAPVIFDTEGKPTPLAYLLGEKGVWFDLLRSALELGRSEPGWPRDTTFENVTVNSTDIEEIASAGLTRTAVIGDSGDTPAHRMIRRAVEKLWPEVDWRDLPVKTRNARINVWAEAHGGQRYGDTTIQRALRGLR